MRWAGVGVLTAGLLKGRLYQHDGGSERTGTPSRVPLQAFPERTFGGWYEGSSPPPAAPTRPRGQPVPLDPRKIG